MFDFYTPRYPSPADVVETITTLLQMEETEDVTPPIPVVAPITATVVSTAMTFLEETGGVGAFLFSHRDFGDIRLMSNWLDPETRYDFLNAGLRGQLLGIPILVSPEVDPGTIFIHGLNPQHRVQIQVTR